MPAEMLKTGLQKTGLFPIARSIYRKWNSAVRIQHRKELAFYSEIMEQGGLCFDVGANLGQRSEIFLDLGQRVIAVEPNATCLPTLEFLFAKNDKVQVVAEAVGPKVGSIVFYAHGTDSTGSVLANWNERVFGSDRGQVSRVVPMTTLDELITRFGHPSFIKIDVEGFEASVIAGLTKSVPMLSFEFHASDLEDMRRCLDQLARLGALSMRACSMDCEWLFERTASVEGCLSSIERSKAKGDLIVWIN